MTINHNLDIGSEKAVAELLNDYYQNWGPFCRALDIPVIAVRDIEPHVVVALILLRMNRDLERRIQKLEARAEGTRPPPSPSANGVSQ